MRTAQPLKQSTRGALPVASLAAALAAVRNHFRLARWRFCSFASRARARVAGRTIPTPDKVEREVFRKVMEKKAPADKATQQTAIIPTPATTSEAPASTSMEWPSEPADFKVGQTVLLNGMHEGIVRYVGPTGFADGDWVGVEMLHRAGEHDGAVWGKRYFSCPEGKGILCHPCQLVEMKLARELEESLMLIEARARACVPFQRH